MMSALSAAAGYWETAVCPIFLSFVIQFGGKQWKAGPQGQRVWQRGGKKGMEVGEGEIEGNVEGSERGKVGKHEKVGGG